MTKSRSARLLGLLVVCWASAVSAQNLLTNPNFDSDVVPWGPTEGDQMTVRHRADLGSTLVGGSGPGCLEVRTLFWTGAAGGPTQSVPVSGGVEYRVEVSALLPIEDNSAVGPFVFLELFAAGFVKTGQLQLTEVGTAGAWTRLSGILSAPAETVEARVWLGLVTSSAAGETRPGIAYYDDALLTVEGEPSLTQSLFVPAAAAVHGLNQTYWSTSGWFSNLTAAEVGLSGALLRQGQANGAAVASPTPLGTIPPRGFLLVEDLVARLGGSELAAGVYLEAAATGSGLPSELVTATTHTFTPNPFGGGVYGQGIPAVAAGTAPRTAVAGVFQGSDLRTNIGALNTSSGAIALTVRVLDATGVQVASADWSLDGYEQRQVGLPALGIDQLTGGTVIFELTGTGSYRGYTSTVDQASGDAVYNAAR